jgi:hypothetical protein
MQRNDGNNDESGSECPWLINLIRQPTFNYLLCVCVFFCVCVCVRVRACVLGKLCVWGWRSACSQHCKMLLVDKRRRLQVSQTKRLTATKTGKNLPLLFQRSSHTSPRCVGLYLFTGACDLSVCIHLDALVHSLDIRSLTISVMTNTSFRGGYIVVAVIVSLCFQFKQYNWDFYLRNDIFIKLFVEDD